MSLFKKKKCDFCGEKIGAFNRGKKFSDGELCNECSTELSPNWHNTMQFSIADAVEHIENRKKNLDVLTNEFHPDAYYGARPTLFVDNTSKLFCITLGSARETVNDIPRYVSENCDLFSFDQIEDTMIYAKDNGVSVLTVTIKNHPWATKITFNDRIASNLQDMRVVDAEIRRLSYTDK